MASSKQPAQDRCDILVVGAGAAGIPLAIEAAARGARIVVVEAASTIGGTLHISTGQMSAAGTRIQAAKGIRDTPALHFADVMRISRGAADPAMVRIAVDNAADTLHWLLDHGLELLPSHPVIHYGHEPYSVPRTYWGPEEGRSILKVLQPLFEREIARGRIDLRLETKLVRLSHATDGAVTGAVVAGPDGEGTIEAGAVALATGGYAANPGLLAELSGRSHYGWAYPFSRGEGLLAAVSAGADLRHAEKFLPTFAGVEDPREPGFVRGLTNTIPQLRPPWEIYVDSSGKRFVAEDETSVDARERALLRLPDLTFWAVYDEAIRKAAPPFFNRIDADDVVRAFAQNRGAFRTANTLTELASAIGIDPDGLTLTVEGYNEAVRRGADDLGRKHLPMTIGTPPFYAVRHQGMSVVGFAGIATDTSHRVVRADGAPIPNLYAVGEILGLGLLSGNAFVGGMSVTPAMSFGRRLGTMLGAQMTASRYAHAGE